jgi:hypothetical protein
MPAHTQAAPAATCAAGGIIGRPRACIGLTVMGPRRV